MKHAPTPWTVADEIYGCAATIRDANGEVIAQVMHADAQEGIANRREQAEVHARLLAVAPELLAALIACLVDVPYICSAEGCECGDFDEKGDCCHVRAHQAIAKAEP